MTQAKAWHVGWTPFTIALMVAGFVIYWPLGLAMLAYIIWGDQIRAGMSEMFGDLQGSWENATGGKPGGTGGTRDESGNAAFDAWRAEELARLEEERRKLDEARAEFDEFMAELRKAKDKEEFDRFMRGRGKRKKS